MGDAAAPAAASAAGGEEKLSKNEQKRRAKAAQKAAEKEKKAAEAAAAAPQGKTAAAAAPAAGAAAKINEEDISPNEYFKLRSEAKKGFFVLFMFLLPWINVLLTLTFGHPHFATLSQFTKNRKL